MSSGRIDYVIQKLLDYFDTVIDEYKKQAEKRLISGTLFHKHGSEGVACADRLKGIWKDILIEITEGHAEGLIGEWRILSYAQMQIDRLMADRRILPGDYKRHSLKTYMFAYRLAMEQWLQGLSIEVLFNKALARLQANGSVEIEKQYHEHCPKPVDISSYEFQQLTRIVLYQLHKKMKLTNIDSNGIDWAGDGKPAHYLPHYCEFTRPDGVGVVYFYPVVDAGANTTTAEFLMDPESWFDDSYQSIENPTDKIIIIPIRQTRHEANYFVTVAAYKNKCYVIEPSSALSGWFNHVDPTVIKAIYKEGTREVVYVDQQGVSDKLDGGLHHINYAVELAVLAPNQFDNSKEVLEALRKTKLYFRNRDDRALAHDMFYREQNQALVGDRELTPQLKFNFEKYVNTKIQEEGQRYQHRALIYVQNELKAYIKSAEEGGHARGEMAAFVLTNIDKKLKEDKNLYDIKTALANHELNHRRLYKHCEKEFGAESNANGLSNDDKIIYNDIYKLFKNQKLIETLKESILVECTLVFSCYKSINEEGSALRKALERSLVLMLNCEADYVNNRTNDLFDQHLKQQMRFYFDEQLYNDSVDILVPIMQSWNNASASFHARHIQKPEGRTTIQEELQRNIEKSYEEFKDNASEAKGGKRVIDENIFGNILKQMKAL